MIKLLSFFPLVSHLSRWLVELSIKVNKVQLFYLICFYWSPWLFVAWNSTVKHAIQYSYKVNTVTITPPRYKGKVKVLPLITERWARSWSRCTTVQAVSPHPSHPLAAGCHYIPPGLRSPSQLKNVTVLRSVSRYTVWWQRHIGVNNLPDVTQLCHDSSWIHDLLIASRTP